MSKLEVIGLGAMNMDSLYRVERILVDGETVVAEAAAFPGGSAANTVYGLAKLGVRSGFIGALGDDAEGSELRQSLAGVGVDVGQIVVKAGATGSALCLSDSLGRRAIYVRPGANSGLTTADLNLDYINRASVLHVSSFADEAQFGMLLELMGRLRESIRVSFSPGTIYAAKGLKALQPMMARTHVLFLNQDEMQRLTGQGAEPGAAVCLREGCRSVVVTLGGGAGPTGASSYIRTAEKEYLVPAADAGLPVIDTTGAGDAFAAGFLFGFLGGHDPEKCARLGDIMARFSIARLGARPGLPTLEELARRYRELYHRSL